MDKKKNVWITGHNGFLGKSLVKELSKNNNIFKISRKDKINKNNLIKTDIDFKIINVISKKI